MSSVSSTYHTRLQNSTLLSQGFVPEHKTSKHSHLGLCLLHIFLALWVCLANASQIINIMLNSKLRCQPKNLLVVNVCVAEVIIGGFLCPMYSDSLMQGTWRHNVDTCIVYEVIFYAQACVSTLAILVLVVERFYYLLTPPLMNGSPKKSLTAVLLLIPWIIGLALVLPTFKNGTTAELNKETQTCQILWKEKFQTVIVFVSFFGPAFLVMTMTAASVMLYVIISVLAKRRDLGPNPDRVLMSDSLKVVLLASFTCVALQFPFFVVLLMEMFCQRERTDIAPCGQPEETWAVVMVIIMLKPGITPLTGAAYTDVRQGFKLCPTVFGNPLSTRWQRRACRRGTAASCEPCVLGASECEQVVESSKV